MDNKIERTNLEENKKNLRKIFINDQYNVNKNKSKFPDNRIKTARYNA